MSNARGSPSFAAMVYMLVNQVPAGRVTTYGTIARLLGDPRKAREVGWAMAASRDPLPAHRVIKAGGELAGGHVCGGYWVHRNKLEAEGVVFGEDGRVDLERFLWLPPIDSGLT